MNKMQKQVLDFHRKFSCSIGFESGSPKIRLAKLRSDLIEEEAAETVAAIMAGNVEETVDGLCDLLYVVFGAAVTFGVDLEPFFDEVHRTNMLKVGGRLREDGKILKPEGWSPPRIKELLKQTLEPS